MPLAHVAVLFSHALSISSNFFLCFFMLSTFSRCTATRCVCVCVRMRACVSRAFSECCSGLWYSTVADAKCSRMLCHDIVRSSRSRALLHYATKYMRSLLFLDFLLLFL